MLDQVRTSRNRVRKRRMSRQGMVQGFTGSFTYPNDLMYLQTVFGRKFLQCLFLRTSNFHCLNATIFIHAAFAFAKLAQPSIESSYR